MPAYRKRAAFAVPVQETVRKKKSAQIFDMMQFPSDLGQYQFLMQFQKYKFTSGREGSLELVDTNKSIAFPLPVRLSQEYSINTKSDVEIGTMTEAALRTLQETISQDVNQPGLFSNLKDSFLGTGEDSDFETTAGGVAKGSAKAVGLAASAGKVGIAGKAAATFLPKNLVTGIEAALGGIYNPVLASAFKGVNIRVHQFEWRMIPRNEAESATLNNIIRKIRKAIHPSLQGVTGQGGGALMDYPDIITCALLLPDNDQNIFYKPAIISSFKVDHNEGNLAFFQGSGNPVTYNIKMTMSEMDVITREDFEDLEPLAVDTKEGE